MRMTLGIAVFSGMLGVTIFGILFTPVFYYVIRKMTGHGGPTTPGSPTSTHEKPNHPAPEGAAH
jgi:multidrug efflux pump